MKTKGSTAGLHHFLKGYNKMRYLLIIMIASSAYLAGYELENKKYFLFLLDIITVVMCSIVYIRG